MIQRRAIFLDRDGVINRNRADYVKSWEEFAFLPRALHALKRTAQAGWTTIITTNQSAIGRGIIGEDAVREIHARMIPAIERAGGCIHAVYFCPHRPEDRCACRKPEVGMFRQAAMDFDLDLTRSYVIGDTLADVASAKVIGARPILVLSGLTTLRDLAKENGYSDCVIADDLSSAVEWIYQAENLPGILQVTRHLDQDRKP